MANVMGSVDETVCTASSIIPKFKSLNVVASRRFLSAASLQKERQICKNERMFDISILLTDRARNLYLKTFDEKSAAEYTGRIVPTKGDAD
jgi:hypothetical protein